MKKILLHTCCAPCAVYTVKRLTEQGFEVTGFWYNPNVHPFTEHRNRLEAMRTFSQATTLPLMVAEGYDVIEFFRKVVGHECERCRDCFKLRLDRTAAVAPSFTGMRYCTTRRAGAPMSRYVIWPVPMPIFW